MAHEITIINGKAETAWVATPPWHGLGQELPENAPLEIWADAAGLNWEAKSRDVFWGYPPGDTPAFQPNYVQAKGYRAIVRSDTNDTLSVVGERYKIVQPREVLGFYRSLIEGQIGWRLETAGTLRGGRRVWALARSEQEFKVMGDDTVVRYLLLATSYDGSMSTIVQPTTVRVVCANTLALAVGDDGRNALVKIPHAATFKPDEIKGKLGLEDNEAWTRFQERARMLAERRVTREEAVDFLIKVFYGDKDGDKVPVGPRSVITKALSVYEGGLGQKTKSAAGTAWGLVNGVTRYVDHEKRSWSPDHRLDNAWFGWGADLKRDAMNRALKMAA